MPVTDDLAAYIDSPCIGVCTIHEETGWCYGCMRTRGEVAGWAGMDAEERAAVKAELETRTMTREQRQSFRELMRARRAAARPGGGA